jgi:hypothetical protein
MAAKPNKTQVTETTVEAFLSTVGEVRRDEARELCALMSRATGAVAKMWGPSIIGFGEHRYIYESGREGVICKLGFSPRKPAIVFYGLGASRNADAVAALGKVTTGKGCVYVKRLTDIDPGRLETLARAAFTTNGD